MKIVFLDAATLGKSDISAFNEFGEVISYDLTKKEDVLKNIADASVIVVNKVIINEEIMQNAKNLKLILVSATGTNNIDLQAAKKLNISVKNVAGYSTNSVVQHTFALLFSFLNHIPYYDDFTKNKKWCNSNIFCDFSKRTSDLNSKNYGIIGLGNIGKKVASVASCFGANVFYTSLSKQNNNSDYKQVSLEYLLQNSDIISIHSPLNEKSKNLITKKELNLMKDESIILNLGRGMIVNEADLAQAIDEKNIKAGLDVLEHEPMDMNNPLFNIQNKQNLIITPHIAWASIQSIDRLIAMMVENLKEFLKEQ